MPSVETRLYRRSSAGRGSNSRLRRPDPALAYPLACPVSPDTSNPTMPAQPSPRACTHVASAPKWTYYRSAAHHPDLPAGAQGCGRHSLKICAAPATKRPPLHIAAAAVRCLPKLEDSSCARPAERARRAHPGSLRESRSRRWAACRGVSPGCRAQLISPQACITLARDPPTDPRWSLFLACATSAGHGCAAWPRCAAITHELPGSRPATPTKPASPTPCGGPGDGRWVAGRRPCQARGNTSSWL